jgi:hypothetical protein
MKNFTIFTLLFALAMGVTPLMAQKNFAGGVGLGGSKLTGDLGKGGSFGLDYYLEGKYFVKDQLAVGLEYNSAAVGYASPGSLLGISFYGNTSVFAKGEYFFTTGKVRPYAGLGLGVAKLSTPELTFTSGGKTTTIPEESKINVGISPRIGLMLGNFGVEFNYTLSGKTPKSTVINVVTSDKAFNFYAITLKYIYPFSF